MNILLYWRNLTTKVYRLQYLSRDWYMLKVYSKKLFDQDKIKFHLCLYMMHPNTLHIKVMQVWDIIIS